MLRQLSISFRLLLVLTVVTGLIYPASVTALAQLFFKQNADGALIVRNGSVVGSALIGQRFQRPEYFHPRPSAAGAEGYDASLSGGSNLGPTNRRLADRVSTAVKLFRRENPAYQGPIPSDLLTASASGLDPDLSPASALAQAARVARARTASRDKIEALVNRLLQGRDLGFIGEPRVNVFLLNLALDQDFPMEGRGAK
jgi:potassium-transporting ATPase KdpC subunit